VSKRQASHRLARRRARVSGLGLAVGVTIAVGGAAVGVLPQLTAGSAAAGAVPASAGESALVTTTLADVPAPTTTPAPARVTAELTAKVAAKAAAAKAAVPAVPARSGDGRRIVFDQSDQRVWLIEDGNEVARTYRVSGSRFDNLQPGSYLVQSKQEHATAFDASGTMDYFVRFATGYSEPIGFHSVPRDNAGKLEQTKAQLGTPLSAGCVRQWEPDAIALWDFAPVGTKVHVTA
jgi:lipoprotein-anchoring transpeptidase ErfK/SrfK